MSHGKCARLFTQMFSLQIIHAGPNSGVARVSAGPSCVKFLSGNINVGMLNKSE